jgi:hypothetical protein
MADRQCIILVRCQRFFLSKYVLGIRVEGEFGSRKIAIEPRLGNLESVAGKVLTELGPISIQCIKANANEICCKIDTLDLQNFHRAIIQ